MTLQRRCSVKRSTSTCCRRRNNGDNNNCNVDPHGTHTATTSLFNYDQVLVVNSLTNCRAPKCCWTVQAYAIMLVSLFFVASESSHVTYVATAAEYVSPRALAQFTGHVGLSLRQLIGQDEQIHSIERISAAAGKEARQQELLAVRHDRRDPLHKFKQYKGGYNLQSKHYLASTLFTGIHGYFLGTIWLLGGVLGAIVAYCRYFHSHKKAVKKPHTIQLSASFIRHSKIKFVPAILSAILVALIISCCALACVESQNFHKLAKKVEMTLIQEGADNATRMINNVTQVMGQMKLDIEHYDQRVAQRLDNTSMRLNNASTMLGKTAQNHKRSLDSALLGLNVGVLVIATTNMILWSFGLACFSISSKLRWPFLMALPLLWILTSLNWYSFGATYSISSFSSDTCEALKEYMDSSRNTTLDNVLPCHDLASGGSMVRKLRAGIFYYIEHENEKIASFVSKHGQQVKRLNVDMVEELATSSIRLCNPFLGPPMYLAHSNCNSTTISISRLPKLLSLFKCPSTNSTKKGSMTACIPLSQYDVAVAFISAIEKFLIMLPEVQKLTNCSFVENTFTILLQRHCGPLQKSIKVVWLAMALLSTLSTFTILLWLLQLWIMKKYKHLFVHWCGTIAPHSSPYH
ncbi:hypothetical protein GOP47_0019550 [Adiantum capillus-veneris]|uniref:Uncharacterized protein n=1 Tax=Adiantum capillus-veneris TaxID=13818 RepID=A0A9D4Z8K5_ADICA|nr:hypothetical protein GOP47_0019550 [Adiantum capillus-veneris]